MFQRESNLAPPKGHVVSEAISRDSYGFFCYTRTFFETYLKWLPIDPRISLKR